MIPIRRKLKEFIFRVFGRFQIGYQEFTAEQWLLQTLKRGTGVRLRMPLQIYHPENLKLGSQIDIGEFSHIRASGGVSIGDRVLIASHVIISSVGHPLLPPRFGVNTSGPIVIEDDVWIGAGAIILQGVRVGAGSVIAAGAVVVDDIPPKSVAAGIPARVLRTTEVRV